MDALNFVDCTIYMDGYNTENLCVCNILVLKSITYCMPVNIAKIA